MPTYEYRCKDCDHQFDIQQSFTDDALTTCPECGGALKKVFGNVGITFKGSGFYKTDSRSGSSSPSSSSDKGSSDKASPDKVSSEKVSSEKASTDKASPDKASSNSSSSSSSAAPATTSS